MCTTLANAQVPYGEILGAARRAGQILRAAVLLVVHLHEQISLLAPCCAQNLAPSRPRLKLEQTLVINRLD